MPDQPVPYQAYKSKRHSRVLSMTAQEFATSPPGTSSPVQSPRVRPLSTEPSTTPPRPSMLNGQPPVNGAAVPLERASSTRSQMSTEPPRTPPRSPISPSLGQSGPEAGSSTVSAGTQPTARTEVSPKSTPRKTTTFRRVPLNKPRSPLPGSPLGSNFPTIPHSRGLSISSIPPLSITGAPPPPSNSISPWPVSLSPVTQVQQLPTASTLPVQPSGISTPHQSSSPVQLESMSNSAPNSRPQSSRGDARLGEEHVPPLKTVTRASAPYRPGFQPKGVYRPLTDDFLALRRQKQDGDGMKRVERTKLERRLEKLIALHFPMPPTVHEKVSKSHRPTGGHERRASSFFEFDLKNIHIVDAGNLWKNVVHAVEGNGKVDIRAEEQRITPWDDDSTTSKCPLCVASFHPLTNRKHHCRLCGKIVCSLPIKRPQRPVPCSTLFVVDPKTKKIEEVGEGVDYGVRRKRPSTGANGIVRMEEDEDRFLKGVRICKECRPVLLRQQYLQETLLVPPFVRLYEIFLLLEKDIESTLPQYQEFVLNLSQDIQPTKEALIIRKRLLESFAQYDTLSKQIRSLQCPRGPGSSPDRVQAAILTRASLFLQKNMLPLQSLPAPSRGGIKPSNGETPKVGPSPDIAHILQPLLEQEALLEGFVEEASAQRKFEDVKSLKANLAEIRAEIEKIVAAEEAGLNNRPRQSEINV